MAFKSEEIKNFYNTVNIITGSGAVLPFICVDNSEGNNWKSPEHPTDHNMTISDTLWREPKEISLNGHVLSEKWEQFKQMTEGSAGKLDLYTITILGGIYKNMALLSLTREESPDENTGYSVTLEFKEVIKAVSKTEQMTKNQVKSANYANTKDSGKQNPEKKEKRKSALRAISDKTGLTR